ncbi:MAG: imidazole glycerol phosphate synthase subunit HisF, partial [Clostridiaceae bacterium]|nr:imidazole glycerol phosphate synthase subunit HisF [Clostridiaceae bacterium]
MEYKRVIPCLDMKDGRVVKGVNFVDFQDAGSIVDAAVKYNAEGADELVILDITASSENRNTVLDIISKVAEKITIPLVVGGGISTIEDIQKIMSLGADKISINSAAIKNPQLINDAAATFGSDCIVLAVDAKRRKDGNGWTVITNGGGTDTGIDVIEWIKDGQTRGAGEILLTSVDCDGVKNGYDNELNKAASQAVGIPIIASGGAGNMQ